MEKADLAILGATPGEISRLPGLLTPAGSLEIAGNQFSTHIYRDLRLLIGTTGLGKVNAAAVAAAALSSFRTSEVWNIGCAGAYGASGLEIGDVLITRNCLCGDEGILETKGALPTSTLAIPLVLKDGQPFYDCFPLDEFLSRRQVRALLPAAAYTLGPFWSIQPGEPCGATERGSGFRVHYGPSLTVSMASGDTRTADTRFRRHGALAENMEGSAIAQTCLLFDVPFLEFRGISNMAGVRDKAQWDLGAALDHCIAVIKLLLDKLLF
jgi:futalosine hydrolase